MARTAVTLSSFAANSTLTATTGTTAVAANGHYVTLTCPLEEVVFQLVNSSTVDQTITFAAGDNPPADAAGVGSLAVAVSTGVTKYVGPLTSARFIQNDGTVSIDATTGSGLKIRAFQVPRTA